MTAIHSLIETHPGYGYGPLPLLTPLALDRALVRYRLRVAGIIPSGYGRRFATPCSHGRWFAISHSHAIFPRNYGRRFATPCSHGRSFAISHSHANFPRNYGRRFVTPCSQGRSFAISHSHAESFH